MGAVQLFRYDINAPEKLRLNEAGTVSVIGYYADGTPEPTDSILCKADVAPAVNGVSISDKCAAIVTIVNDASNFAKSSAPVALTITVHARRRYAWFNSPVSVSKTISLLDEAQPEITAIDAPQDDSGVTVLIGGIAHFRVDFKAGKPPSDIRCQWYQDGSAANPFSPSEACNDVTFAAPKTAIRTTPSTVNIGVNVTDQYGHAIGSATATVNLHLPRANFTALVVDTSSRMQGRDFDAAASRINREISSLALDGGWLSLTSFGGETDPNVACSPAGVHQLYKLAPFSASEAEASAKNVTVGAGQWAPLKLAIEIAASQFAQPPLLDRANYPDNLFYFIVLTGGGDTCNRMPFRLVFQAMRAALPEGELRRVYFDSELLAAVIATALSPEQSAAIRQDPAYKEDNEAVLFAPRGPEELTQILDDLTILADLKQPRERRVRACKTLGTLVSKDDEHAVSVITRHCSVVAQR